LFVVAVGKKRNGECQELNPKKDYYQSCSTSSVSFPVGAVIAGGCAFILLAAVAVLMILRNRSINAKYQRLQETLNSTVELHTIEDEEEQK
jgi:hypothetical protein